MSNSFPIIEIFGPTLQGEGPQIGLRSTFVRFAGCDLRCTWCDSMHAVSSNPRTKMLSIEETLSRIRSLLEVEWVVLTGGNPLLYDLSDLVSRLQSGGYRVAVETQGTLWKPWITWVDCLVVSPKPKWSQPEAYQQRTCVDHRFEHLRKSEFYKIVVFEERDLDFAEQFSEVGDHLYLSCGTLPTDSSSDVLQRLRDLTKRSFDRPALRSAHFLPQLHVLLWGHKRGV